MNNTYFCGEGAVWLSRIGESGFQGDAKFVGICENFEIVGDTVNLSFEHFDCSAFELFFGNFERVVPAKLFEQVGTYSTKGSYRKYLIDGKARNYYLIFEGKNLAKDNNPYRVDLDKLEITCLEISGLPPEVDIITDDLSKFKITGKITGKIISDGQVFGTFYNKIKE